MLSCTKNTSGIVYKYLFQFLVKKEGLVYGTWFTILLTHFQSSNHLYLLFFSVVLPYLLTLKSFYIFRS